MEKKQYIFPVVDVALLRTRELMIISEGGSGLPTGPGTGNGAPRRKTDVF